MSVDRPDFVPMNQSISSSDYQQFIKHLRLLPGLMSFIHVSTFQSNPKHIPLYVKEHVEKDTCPSPKQTQPLSPPS